MKTAIEILKKELAWRLEDLPRVEHYTKKHVACRPTLPQLEIEIENIKRAIAMLTE